jgi:hypothetical protein
LFPAEQRRSGEHGILLSSTERARWSWPVDGEIAMLDSKEVSLTDVELDQVAGGFLQIVAGVAVGAVLGAGALVVAVAVGDYVRHHTGKDCIFQ